MRLFTISGHFSTDHQSKENYLNSNGRIQTRIFWHRRFETPFLFGKYSGSKKVFLHARWFSELAPMRPRGSWKLFLAQRIQKTCNVFLGWNCEPSSDSAQYRSVLTLNCSMLQFSQLKTRC